MNTEIENEFASAFVLRGGLFNINILEEPRRSELQGLLNSLQKFLNNASKKHPELPACHIGIINSSKVSASATKFNGRYFIGINAGTIFLTETIVIMVVNCGILERINDSTFIRTDFERINLSSDYSDFQAENPHFDHNSILEQHSSLSISVTYFIVQFLMLHEFGHIIFGHVDYLNSIRKQEVVITEFDYQVADELSLSPMDMQSLELDADYYAAQIAIRDLLYYHKNVDNISNNYLKRLYYHETEFLKTWFASMNILFKVYHDGQDSRNLSIVKYPPPTLRQYYIYLNFFTVYQIENGIKATDAPNTELMNYIFDLLIQSSVMTEKAFDTILKNNNDPFRFLTALQKEYETHLINLSLHFNIMRTKLLPFSFGNLAPDFKLV